MLTRTPTRESMTLDNIRAALRAHRPALASNTDSPRAAVAVVLASRAPEAALGEPAAPAAFARADTSRPSADGRSAASPAFTHVDEGLPPADRSSAADFARPALARPPADHRAAPAFARARQGPRLADRMGVAGEADPAFARAHNAQVLLIQRAERERDPWSGQMAFPGGRVERADASAAVAARRETREEVGLSLENAELLGQLDDLPGRRAARPANLVISAFVYHLPTPGALALQASEVQHAFFFPFDELANPARHVRRRFRETGADAYPGIVVGEHERHVVWGLTYRFIENLHQILARDFPAAAEAAARARDTGRTRGRKR